MESVEMFLRVLTLSWRMVIYIHILRGNNHLTDVALWSEEIMVLLPKVFGGMLAFLNLFPIFLTRDLNKS